MPPNPIDSLRLLLQEKRADALLVTGEEDTFYLSRFPCTYGRFLITKKKAFFITDSRYKLDAEKSLFLKKNYSIKILIKGFHPLFQELCSAEKIQTCIIESQKTTLCDLQELKTKTIGITFIPLENTVASLREFKTSVEALKITQALRIAEQSFKQTLSLIKSGITEKDIRTELEYRFAKNGADSESFETIVASGINAATPHAHATNKKIRAGEMIIVDFGVKKDGYCSDTTRTIFLGKPDSLFKKRYEAVKQAMIKSEQEAFAGKHTKDIDAIARNLLKKEKLDSYFTHSLGHGCGLEVHERPYLNPKSENILKPGAVVTIEPGIYIKGWGGIRIEDMVLVTSVKPKILTKLTKEMTIL